MSTHIIFIYILVVHFIADFVLQTHKQATGKGEGFSLWNKQLFYHVGIYSSVWFIPSLLLNIDAGAFVLITFICHYITDWWTSRWVWIREDGMTSMAYESEHVAEYQKPKFDLWQLCEVTIKVKKQ